MDETTDWSPLMLFERAVALDGASRAAFLDASGAPDAVRKRVEAMLAADEEASPLDRLGAGHSLLRRLGTSEATVEGLPVLAGHYRIIRKIGEGGCGVVYEAEQSMPRRLVALKAVHAGARGVRAVARLRREADAQARLRHPGIAQVYEAGVSDEVTADQAFIAMELVHGRDIAKHVRATTMSRREVIGLMLLVCDAVAHAHARGVIHRDLKPANILIDADGKPKVLDFGLARLMEGEGADSLTLGGEIIGTLAYMSPEQASGGAADARTDVYALGVVLHELLLGRTPIDMQGLSVHAALERIRGHEPLGAGKLAKAVGRDLAVIIARSCDPDATRRYQTVAQLADDLRRHLEGRPIEARRDSALYVAQRIARRHWKLTAGLAALGMFLSALSINLSLQATRMRELAESEKSAHDRASGLREQADRLNVLLRDEVESLRIERARFEARAGNPAAAEERLWRSLIERPGSAAARWALHELYDQYPCMWSVRTAMGDARIIAGSRDGRAFAISGVSGGVMLLDAETGAEVARGAIEGADGATSIMFDGAGRIVTTHRLGDVAAWEQRGGAMEVVRRFKAHEGPIVCGDVHPATGRVVTGVVMGEVALHALEDGAEVWRIHPTDQAVNALAFASDGATVLAGCESGAVLLIDARDGSVLREDASERRAVTTAAFVPGGSRVVVGSRDRTFSGMFGDGSGDPFSMSVGTLPVCTEVDGSGRMLLAEALAVWVVQWPGREMHRAAFPNSGVVDAAWAGDRIVLLDGNGIVRAWGPRQSPGLVRLTGHVGWTFGAEFLPGGEALVTGGSDATVRVWDLETGSTRSETIIPDKYRSRMVRIVPDGSKIIAGCANGQVAVIDANTGQALRWLGRSNWEVWSVAVHPDGRTIAAGDRQGTIRLWDIESGEVLAEVNGLESTVRGCVFSPDGGVLYSSGEFCGVTVRDGATLEKRGMFETPSEPWGVDVTADGKTVAAGLFDASVAFVDAASGRVEIGDGRHHFVVAGLRFSPDGSLLASAGEDGSVNLWDTATRKPVSRLDLGHGATPGLAWSDDGTKLAGATSTGVIAVWDLEPAWSALGRSAAWAIDTFSPGATDEQRALVLRSLGVR